MKLNRRIVMNVCPEQVSLDKPYEIRHWMHKLGCTEFELYEAVRSVGKGLVALRVFRSTCPVSIYPLGAGAGYRRH
jgi:hypothetical protein